MGAAPWAIFILAGLGAAAALAVLYTFAVSMERARELHDLRVRVFELRNAYLTRLGRRGAEDEVIVAEVDAHDGTFAGRIGREDQGAKRHPPTATGAHRRAA